MPTKAILFFFGCTEVNSTWLSTSELANQRVRKALFTCVVYANVNYSLAVFKHVFVYIYLQALFAVLRILHNSGYLF